MWGSHHILPVAALAVLPLGALAGGTAEPQTALDWLRAGAGFETRPHDGGTWAAEGGEIYATDPLTLWNRREAPLRVPETPARVVGLQETTEGRTAFMALIWSNAPVVCGKELSVIGVDTGLAGFLTPADLAALDDYGKPYQGELYVGTYADQLDAQYPTVPFLVELPGGARFPVAGSGWGDGGYPVASLHDAQGRMVALYAQFITGDKGWLDPPPCPAQNS